MFFAAMQSQFSKIHARKAARFFVQNPSYSHKRPHMNGLRADGRPLRARPFRPQTGRASGGQMHPRRHFAAITRRGKNSHVCPDAPREGCELNLGSYAGYGLRATPFVDTQEGNIPFASYSERELLARLIQCEAGGEGDNGMRAVASIIMNRVRAPGGEYARLGQGNLYNIVFQPGQFTCVQEVVRGMYNPQNIYNMNPTEVHYSIADWALAGNRLTNLGQALWFYNPYSSGCRGSFPSNVGSFQIRIGEHCFYNPTNAYLDT